MKRERRRTTSIAIKEDYVGEGNVKGRPFVSARAQDKIKQNHPPFNLLSGSEIAISGSA